MKSKVTKIVKMDKKDTYGNTSFIIELESGDHGYYTSKSEDQKKFVVGNVANYDIEEKQGAKGKYYKITVPQSDGAIFSKGGKAPVDPRAQFIGFSAAYSKDLVVAGKVSIDNMNAFADAIFKNMIKLYETIK